jgi:hypothetical protein
MSLRAEDVTCDTEHFIIGNRLVTPHHGPVYRGQRSRASPPRLNAATLTGKSFETTA